MKIPVIVVGLGAIGMGYDFESNSKSSRLSHSGSVHNHPSYSLVGGVDPDKLKRENFEKFFQSRSYSSIHEALIENRPRLIIISTPNFLRLNVIKEIIEIYKPEVILLEKPIATTIEEGTSIVKLCAENRIKLFVNYMRTASPGILNLKKWLIAKNYTGKISGNIWYQGGLINNASHIVNLLECLFGPAEEFKILKVEHLVDVDQDNPYGAISFSNGYLSVTPINSSYAKTNGFHVFLENESLEFSRELNGVILRKVINDSVYIRNLNFSSETLIFPIEVRELQTEVLNQIELYLNGNNVLLCTGEQAFKTLKVLLSGQELGRI